ncbi:hypothetical protein COOONC_00684 [Cooperia oncophora]
MKKLGNKRRLQIAICPAVTETCTDMATMQLSQPIVDLITDVSNDDDLATEAMKNDDDSNTGSAELPDDVCGEIQPKVRVNGRVAVSRWWDHTFDNTSLPLVEPGYDPAWIEEQVQNPLVLGTTYGCHPHYAVQYKDT